MATTPISATPPADNSAALAALNQKLGAAGGHNSLGQADFLNLLVGQLQNQDPLQPMQDTAFISQMANFSSLQQMTALTNDFNTFSSGALVNQAQGYLGQRVTVTDPSLGNISGVVTAVDTSSGTPQIIVNGTSYGLSAVQNITLNTATANPPTN
jgi:flagellar basal-body rod modification protein FlgD